MSARVATYLDVNAGAPPSLRVIEALLPFLSDPRSLTGNPSSTHSFGRKAKSLLREARDHVARSLSADPTQVIFTSSGTESCQLAIRAVLEHSLMAGEKPHWILTAAEHEAVEGLTEWLQSRGGSVSRIPLDDQGRPELSRLEGLIQPQTRLISAIWVHNETGVITDIQTLSAAARARGIKLHLDGSQAWGKLPIRVQDTGADLISFSGHKIGALAGTGALWIRPGVPLSAQWAAKTSILPGSHEGGRRGGTENLLGIISLGAASAQLDVEDFSAKTSALRAELEKQALERIPGSKIYGIQAPRVCNTTLLGLGGIPADPVVMGLDLEGFAVSAGSACSSGVQGPSRVLQAMGLDDREARSRIRVSLHPELGLSDIHAFVGALERVVARHEARFAPNRFQL